MVFHFNNQAGSEYAFRTHYLHSTAQNLFQATNICSCLRNVYLRRSLLIISMLRLPFGFTLAVEYKVTLKNLFVFQPIWQDSTMCSKNGLSAFDSRGTVVPRYVNEVRQMSLQSLMNCPPNDRPIGTATATR